MAGTPVRLTGTHEHAGTPVELTGTPQDRMGGIVVELGDSSNFVPSAIAVEN